MCLASRNSAYNLNSCVPAGLDPDCCSSFIATSSGARLTVPGSGVAVTVPEGSLTRGQKEEVIQVAKNLKRKRIKILE